MICAASRGMISVQIKFMLPFVAISISFTLTTILLLFSVPIDFQKSVSVKSLHFLQKWLIDWKGESLVEPEPMNSIVSIVSPMNSIVSIVSMSESELDANQIISNLNLSFLESSVSIFPEEIADNNNQELRSPTIVQIQLYCIIFSVSLIAIYFAVLPFYQFVSSCPRQRSRNRFEGYQNPLQKRISEAMETLCILFRLKKVSSWKMSILDDLSTTQIKKPIENVAPLADASGKRVIKSLHHLIKPPNSTQNRNVSIPSVKLVIDKTTNRVFSTSQIESKCVPSTSPPLDYLSIQSTLVPPHQSQNNQQQSTQFSLQSSYLFM